MTLRQHSSRSHRSKKATMRGSLFSAMVVHILMIMISEGNWSMKWQTLTAAKVITDYAEEQASAPSPSPSAAMAAPAADSSPSPSPSPSHKPRHREYHGSNNHRSNNMTKNGTLDPSQEEALRALGFKFIDGLNPCSRRGFEQAIGCDEGRPFRHVVSITLQYCTEDAELPSQAWSKLSATLQSLTFRDCPAKPFQVPRALARSLTSLTCSASLGRSVDNVLAPGLPTPWLAQFSSLTEITIADVVMQANDSSFGIIMNAMDSLQLVTFSNTHLSGPLPHQWPPHINQLNLPGNDFIGPIPSSLIQLSQLQSLDLSSNKLEGIIPHELSKLQNLEYLSLASNHLTGPIPDFLQNLSSLVYLDLSDNQINGSIPTFFMDLPSLRYIDLQKNNLEGEVPFAEAYLRTLNAFKVGGNLNLCYNKSMTSAKYGGGVLPCDDSTLAPKSSPNYDFNPMASPQPDPFKGVSSRRGPNKVVLVIALALACSVGAIITTALLSRRCPSKS